jgi:integrase
MATIEKRTSRSGAVTWRVKWRSGGRRDGAWDGETCDDLKTARSFRALVEAAGEQRPPGYLPGCRGQQTAFTQNGVPAVKPGEHRPGSGGPHRQTTEALLQTLLRLTEAERGSVRAERSFGDVFEEYLQRLRKLRKVEPRQLTDYRRAWERHVAYAVVHLPDKGNVGPLGAVDVREVTADVVEAWVAWMGERRWTYSPKDTTPKPYSPKTIANVHGTVVSPVLGFAAIRGYIDANPAAGMELPERRGHTVTLDHVPTGNEPEMWITLGYEVSNLAGDVIAIAFGTGLRWGEIAALRPCDINLEAGLLTVNQVIKQDENRHLYIAGYGKTDAAQRTTRLPRRVIAVLRRRVEGVHELGLIFTGVRGGILNPSGNWHKNHWSKVIARAKAAGIFTQATPHKFRHSHATSLLGANVSLDTVSKRLGHASSSTTSDLYGHLAPEADKAAVGIIDDLIGEEPPEAEV